MPTQATTITAVIVDDEAHARQALVHLLKKFPTIKVIAECENGITGIKAINDLKPMLIFLDIHMPKLDGFEVLELLGDNAPMTIFVTAHDEYAIQAFENNALDYLLKPVNSTRLEKTIERACQRFGAEDQSIERLARHTMLDEIKQKQAPIARLLIRDKGDVQVVASREIVAIEAADDYVVIHTANESHIKQDRLSHLETLLDSQLFCRIHRSTIINLEYLQGIETEGKETRFATMKLTEKKTKQFSISRSGYTKLLEIL